MEDTNALGWASIPVLVFLLLGLHFLFDLSWWQSIFLAIVGAAAFGIGIVFILGGQLADIQKRLPL